MSAEKDVPKPNEKTDVKTKPQKAETPIKRKRIPDYEHLFVTDENAKEKDIPKKRKKEESSWFLKSFFKNNFWSILLSMLLYVIKALPVWGIPIITSNIINIATNPVDENTTTAIVINAVVLVAMALENYPMHRIYAHVTNTMLRNTSIGIKGALIRKLQTLSISYHNEMESGAIQSKFLKDTESVDLMLRTMLINVIPNIIGVIIAFGIAVVKGGTVSLFFLALIPLNVVLPYLFRKKVKASFKNYRIESEYMSAKMTNMLSMLAVTKAHGLEEHEIHNIDATLTEVREKGLLVDRVQANFGSVAWIINQLLNGACLIFCAVLAINKIIGVGDVVLYQSLFVSISNYISGLVNLMPQIHQGLDAVASVTEVMRSEDVEMNAGKYVGAGIEGNVSFKNVSYRYPSNSSRYVVHNFNLEVKAGECIAVVGSSGSGKSTLMNLIIGFMKPVEGEIDIDGRPLNDYNLSEYRHNLSVVPQNSLLFSGTIRDNIVYGLPKYTEEQLQEVVEKANLNEFLQELPNGIDTHIGEGGAKLSGGQKQRITIARALIRNPKILILDEATSALDNVSEYHVQQAISSSIQGRTTFIVAHRLSTIRDADRIVVLDNGETVEIGTYEELMAKKGKFYELKKLSDIVPTELTEEQARQL